MQRNLAATATEEGQRSGDEDGQMGRIGPTTVEWEHECRARLAQWERAQERERSRRHELRGSDATHRRRKNRKILPE